MKRAAVKVLPKTHFRLEAVVKSNPITRMGVPPAVEEIEGDSETNVGVGTKEKRTLLEV